MSPARNPRPRDAASPCNHSKSPQPSPAGRQLLLTQLFGVSIAFLEDFAPHLQILVSVQGGQRANVETRDPTLTGAGEVPTLDGVACARVHPARGLGLIAAKDKEWGCQRLGGPREPLPIAGEGSLQRGGLFQPKEWKDGILGKEGNDIHQAGRAVSPKERGERRDDHV